jgi:hypothetical protein
MSRYVLTINRWQPATINQLLRRVRTRIRLKKVDRNMVIGYCLKNRIPVATGPREVNLTIVLGPRQRGCDPDAYNKSLGDALVKAKMLIDDSRRYVRWQPAQYVRGLERGTMIELIDLEE